MSTALAVQKTQIIKKKKSGPLIIDSKDSITDQFAKWLYQQTMSQDKMPNGCILSRQECAKKINSLRLSNGINIKDGRVDYGDVTAFISKSRVYCEENLNCTIWTVHGRGWRASTEIETAKYCGKTLRRTLAWMDRSRRVYAITNKRLFHHAIREIATEAGQKIANMSGMRKKFMEMWGTYAESEQKQIEAAKN